MYTITATKKHWFFVFAGLILFGVIIFLDKALAIGICLIIFLTVITFWVLMKKGFKTKAPYILFLITLSIFFTTSCLFYYTHFQPFSGGLTDATTYNQEAVAAAQQFRHGDFSLRGLSFDTYFAVPIGILYALTIPATVIGNSFMVWWAALCILFIFLIVREIGGSEKEAFITGLVALIYPSYIFYCSFMLRDAVIVPLAIIGLFLVIKLCENFLWRTFALLYIIIGAEVHLRIYIGYAVLVTFLFGFLFLSGLPWKKKALSLLIILPLLGFLPQISGYGYYGKDFLFQYLNPQIIAYYHDSAYKAETYAPSTPSATVALPKNPTVITPAPSTSAPAPAPSAPSPDTSDTSQKPAPLSTLGFDSSFSTHVHLKNPILNFLGKTAESLVYVVLGPLPWQMKYARQFLALAETIPWYILLYFIVRGIIISIRHKNKFTFPLLFFSIVVLVILAMFVTNFGIITRIRIPVFLSLLCFASVGFRGFDVKEKIFALKERFKATV